MNQPDRPTPPGANGKPLLRQAFDTVERAIATRAEPLARTGGFARALGVYVAVNRGVRGVAGKATGGVLHLVNIPTVGDLAKLHRHLSSVDDHIADLIRDQRRDRSPVKELEAPQKASLASSMPGSASSAPSAEGERAARPRPGRSDKTARTAKAAKTAKTAKTAKSAKAAETAKTAKTAKTSKSATPSSRRGTGPRS